MITADLQKLDRAELIELARKNGIDNASRFPAVTLRQILAKLDAGDEPEQPVVVEGLSPLQSAVLLTLDAGALDLFQIAVAAGIESPTASCYLTQLERRDLVERVPGQPVRWRRVAA